MPAVPGTVSSTMAAIVDGPSQSHDLLEVLERPGGLLLLACGVERRTVEKRAEEMHRPRAAVVVRPAPRLACQIGGRRRAPVIGAIGGQKLDAAGVEPRHAGGVLDRLGAVAGEKDLAHPLRGELGDQAGSLVPRPVGVQRAHGAEQVGLGLDGRHDLGVLVADVGIHELGREVQVALARVVGEVGALRPGDQHRLDDGLGRPRVEHVPAVCDHCRHRFCSGDRLWSFRGGNGLGHEAPRLFERLRRRAGAAPKSPKTTSQARRLPAGLCSRAHRCSSTTRAMPRAVEAQTAQHARRPRRGAGMRSGRRS